VRTYDRAMYQRIQKAWRDFGHEWHAARLAAAERGFPLPPEGSGEDDRDDAEPSQRAIIWRALDWRPTETLGYIKRSSSWSQVVGLIIGSEARLREDAALREKDADWERRDDVGPRQATATIAAILRRIGESMP